MNAKKVFDFLAFVLSSSGLWIPFHKSKSLQRIYLVYSIFFLLFTIVFTMPLVASIFFVKSVEDIPERILMSTTKMAMINKLIPLIIHNANIQHIRNAINKFKIKSLHEEEIIEKRIDIFVKLMYIFFVLPHFTISVLNIATILSEERRLTFVGCYPFFDWTNNDRDYWILYFFQYIGITITGIVNITIDLFYCFLMYAISVEFEILGERLKSIEMKQSSNATKLELTDHMETLKSIHSLVNTVKSRLSSSYFSQVIFSAIVIFACTEKLARVSIFVLLA